MTNFRRPTFADNRAQGQKGAGRADGAARMNGSVAIELSGRQRDVLQLLWQGETNKGIAKQLNMGESTVNVHIRSLMKMLGAHNRTQVVLLTKRLLGPDTDSGSGRRSN